MGSAVFTDPLAHSRAPFRFAATRRSYRSRRRLRFARRWFVPSGASKRRTSRSVRHRRRVSRQATPKGSHRKAPPTPFVIEPRSAGLGSARLRSIRSRPAQPWMGALRIGCLPPRRTLGRSRPFASTRAQSFPYERDRGTPLESCDSTPSRPGPVMGLPRRLGFDPVVQTPIGFPV
jgi:hypothetical protein